MKREPTKIATSVTALGRVKRAHWHSHILIISSAYPNSRPQSADAVGEHCNVYNLASDRALESLTLNGHFRKSSRITNLAK